MGGSTPQFWQSHGRRALLAGLTALLVAGCTTGWRSSHRSASPAPTAASPRGSARSAVDPDLERRVDAYARFAAGVAHDLRREPRQAEAEFSASLEADPSHETLALELSRRYLRNREPARAVEVLLRASRQPHASSDVFGWLGVAQVQVTNQAGAIKAFREATRRAPDSFLGYRGLAQVHLGNGRTNEALRVLEEAATRKNAPPALLIEMAGFYLLLAEEHLLPKETAEPRALALLDRATALNPVEPELLAGLAEGYHRLQQLPRAITLYEALLRDHGSAGLAMRQALRRQLFDLYLRERDATNAHRHLEGLLTEQPTNPQAHYALATLYLEEKRYPDAARHLEQAILLNPDLEPAYYQLVGLQLALGRPDLAADTMARARSRFPAGFLLEFYTGLSLAAQEKYLEALDHYAAAELHARVHDPTRLTHFFYFQLGSANERLGRFAEAEAALRRCLELDPRNAEALNYLGYMWAERGVNLTEARSLIDRALAIEPDNPAFLDSLAWVLYQQGDAAAALEPQRRAVALMPEPDATLFDHLGDIYHALGRTEEAREAWRKSVAIEPDPKVEQKLLAHPETAAPR
ncbi:MAG: tetratricopeptide repeat protein [Verrucomicrobiales bacterium]|nr:tetratricopeptide repeat protein [Verrucomicrobiales bacterium]